MEKAYTLVRAKDFGGRFGLHTDLDSPEKVCGLEPRISEEDFVCTQTWTHLRKWVA